MSKTTLIFGLSLAIACAASANDQPKPFKAEYTIYSGELGEERPATRADRKLAVEVTGQAAKDIFESMYPDAGVACSDVKGERLRSKKNLWCSYRPNDGYRCYLGFNLRTGDSITGASC